MLSRIMSATFLGVDSYVIEVEVDTTNGLPIFNIVGLPDAAISESKERVRAAIKNSGYEVFPRRITVNLSPAGVRKEGSAFDLPIAIGMLSSFGFFNENSDTEFKKRLESYLVIGELSLSGDVKRTKGVINAALCAKEHGYLGVLVPYENFSEASIVDEVEIVGVKNLTEAVEFLTFGKKICCQNQPELSHAEPSYPDFSDVKGQSFAKRGMEIAAAGGHNIFMMGSPGSGKSMLAKRLPGIMPRLNQREIIETTKIYSSAGLLDEELPIIRSRPFRSPHHSASDIALVGGGKSPKPGEISLAHNGVLFLDEVGEFSRRVLETLRQPLEDGKINISKANYKVDFPSEFILVLASNPCKCGYLFEMHSSKRCTCTQSEVKNYVKKISGPILDRVDLYVEMRRVPQEELLKYGKGDSSSAIKDRVEAARELQNRRYDGMYTNSNIPQKYIMEYCKLDAESGELLKSAGENLGLSARAFDKILRVARTIADLEGSIDIKSTHIMEAISFRKK